LHPNPVLTLPLSTAMQLALEILGYPTYHTTRILSNPPDADMWMEAINAKYLKQGSTTLDRHFWDGLLGNYGATTDIPAGSFHEELHAAYPDVKCILVERDVEGWYKSWHDVQIKQYGNLFFKIVATIDPEFIGRIWTFSATGVLEGICGAKSKRDLEEKSRRIYLEHNEKVKATVPADKLLLYRLGDGWEPLCRFLGKPVPDVPFPRVNETEMVNEYVGIVIKMGLVNTLKRWAIVATPVVAGGVAWWWYRRMI